MNFPGNVVAWANFYVTKRTCYSASLLVIFFSSFHAVAQAPLLTITNTDITTSSTYAFQNGFNLNSLITGNPHATYSPPPYYSFHKYFGLLGDDNILEYDSAVSGSFQPFINGGHPVQLSQQTGVEYENSPESEAPFTIAQGEFYSTNDLIAEHKIEFSLTRASTLSYTHFYSVFTTILLAPGTSGFSEISCEFVVLDSANVVKHTYEVSVNSDLPPLPWPVAKIDNFVLPPGNYKMIFTVDSFSEVYGTFAPGAVSRATANGFLINGSKFSAQFISLAGDYNGDGIVSQPDLDLVLLNWGSSTQPAGWVADEQFDGLISQPEQDKVLLNWGNTAY